MPLDRLLDSLARELDRMHGLALDAQDAASILTTGSHAGSSGGPPGPALVGLQALDVLAQHLAGLSAFVAACAATLPDGPEVDVVAAAGTLTLGALRARLTGEGDAGGPPEDTSELF